MYLKYYDNSWYGKTRVTIRSDKRKAKQTNNMI